MSREKYIIVVHIQYVEWFVYTTAKLKYQCKEKEYMVMYVNKSACRMVRLYYCQSLIPNSSKRWATCTTVKDISLGITSFAAWKDGCFFRMQLRAKW